MDSVFKIAKIIICFIITTSAINFAMKLYCLPFNMEIIALNLALNFMISKITNVSSSALKSIIITTISVQINVKISIIKLKMIRDCKRVKLVKKIALLVLMEKPAIHAKKVTYSMKINAMPDVLMASKSI